jgi:hypothetical protein
LKKDKIPARLGYEVSLRSNPASNLFSSLFMNYIAKAISIKKEVVLFFTQFVALFAISAVVPFFIHQQAITGPIVNAVLFISASLLGSQSAILIGLFPSLIALSTGLLPVALAPIIPFIMVGNIILVLVFSKLKNKNFWLAILSASFLKFLFLFASSSIVINLISQNAIAKQVALAMSWSQLATAFAGGIIAYMFLYKKQV